MPSFDRQLRLDQLNDAFRPAGPIDVERLFAGRTEQRGRVASALSTPGQHVVIYGERGVGKTSLAAISVNSARERGVIAMRVNCSPKDDFQLIWDAMVDQVAEQRDMPWWDASWDAHVSKFFDIMGRDTAVLAEPDRIRLGLSRLAQAARVLVFFDEYDQIEDSEVSQQMASTIKTLSDHLVNVTIGIVGVAASIDDLIEGHQSIQRCLDQIPMPRMSAAETEHIVTRGWAELNLTPNAEVLHFINRAAMGFPQYAHLLGRSFARAAISSDATEIKGSQLHEALSDAVSGVHMSVTGVYNAATFSPNTLAHYRSVLLACALTPPIDSEGFFQARDVAEPLSVLLGRNVKSDTYNKHLVEFCEDRGPILERRGQPNKWRYRFRDVAMGPYVILLGALEGFVRFNLRDDLSSDDPSRPSRRPRSKTPSIEQQPLF